MLKTPVAFIIFKRPNTTEKVFEAIRQAKPSKLLVIADGPRPDKPGEVEKCATTRAIIDRVDWDCEVLKNYSEVNLGCGKRVSSGLDWVFNQVEEAIILEDDCLPDLTFFHFCQELLDYYRHNDRIGIISGQNVQFGKKRTDYSYYFSRYNPCWGWATWKRAWQHFDFEMKLWPIVRDGNWLQDLLGNKKDAQYWAKIFQSTYENHINSWAYRWTFTCWVNNYINIISNVNLITNIGIGSDATNTSGGRIFAIKSQPTIFPIKHQPFIIRDNKADEATQNFFYSKIKRKIIEVKIRQIILNSIQHTIA